MASASHSWLRPGRSMLHHIVGWARVILRQEMRFTNLLTNSEWRSLVLRLTVLTESGLATVIELWSRSTRQSTAHTSVMLITARIKRAILRGWVAMSHSYSTLFCSQVSFFLRCIGVTLHLWWEHKRWNSLILLRLRNRAWLNIRSSSVVHQVCLMAVLLSLKAEKVVNITIKAILGWVSEATPFKVHNFVLCFARHWIMDVDLGDSLALMTNIDILICSFRCHSATLVLHSNELAVLLTYLSLIDSSISALVRKRMYRGRYLATYDDTICAAEWLSRGWAAITLTSLCEMRLNLVLGRWLSTRIQTLNCLVDVLQLARLRSVTTLICPPLKLSKHVTSNNDVIIVAMAIFLILIDADQ